VSVPALALSANASTRPWSSSSARGHHYPNAESIRSPPERARSIDTGHSLRPSAGCSSINSTRLTALAKAYAWQEQLESGQFEDLEDIAKEQGVDRSYVGRMLQLTSLAPDIVESILAGQAFADISLQHCRKGIPVFWEEQRRTLIAAD
jgi:hypothetical protein